MLDRMGSVIASLCAIHCAIVPVLMAATSSFTIALLSWRDPHHGLAVWLLRMSVWEVWVVLFAIVFAITSMSINIRLHRNPGPAAMVTAGTASFVLALFSPWAQTPALHALFAVAGGLLLASAHILNLKLSRTKRRTVQRGSC